MRIDKAEFESKRVVVIQGKIINENTAIQLSAINENIILQRAKIIFPEKLNISTWIVYPPKPIFSLQLLRTRLQNIIDNKINKIEGAIIVNSFDSSPIVIESFYVAKGISYTDRSLYLIDYSFGINGDSSDPPFINFRGLVFKQG